MSPRRLVIANRGEIARRILAAARSLGWTAAVISCAEDRDARVRREADAVLEVSGFLDLAAIVAASRDWGAQLLHPGYGFLSEHAGFAEAVEAAGIAFVGPTPAAMRALGNKESAKAVARACGVPVLEGLSSAELAALEPERWAALLASRGIRAPYLVKASGGGGGRGMRTAASSRELAEAVRRAAQEAQAWFGDGAVFVERLLLEARHVEAQVFGDGRGGGVFLGERECSLQRRHQKVLEEAPSSAVGADLRAALGRAALALVRQARYRGAGTVEFLLEPDGAFHFLEVNARIQVEHPVTELTAGVDLVRAQLELAEGRWPAELGDPGRPEPPAPRGVALEARVLAEDPRGGFRPTPGPLRVYREPRGEGIRVDSGVAEGDRVNGAFDSMIAKVVAWGPDRASAAARLAAALEDFVILGCTSNLPLLLALLRHPDFQAGRVHIRWLEAHLEQLNAPLLPGSWLDLLRSVRFREALALALRGTAGPVPAALRFAALAHPDLRVGSLQECGPIVLEPGAEPNRFTLRGAAALIRDPAQESADDLVLHACRADGATLALACRGEVLELADPTAGADTPDGAGADGDAVLRAPMAGKVLEVLTEPGRTVESGQVLFVVESMKMQFEVRAPRRGTVTAVRVTAGQSLAGPEPLADFSVLPSAPGTPSRPAGSG